MRTVRGIGLVEILIAVAIVGLAITVLLGAFSFAVRTNLRARHTAIAHRVASQEMELLRVTPFAQFPANQNQGAFVGSVSDLDRLPQGQATLTIANYPSGSTSGDMREVTIEVRWNEGSLVRQISLTTIVGEGGINP